MQSNTILKNYYQTNSFFPLSLSSLSAPVTAWLWPDTPGSCFGLSLKEALPSAPVIFSEVFLRLLYLTFIFPGLCFWGVFLVFFWSWLAGEPGCRPGSPAQAKAGSWARSTELRIVPWRSHNLEKNFILKSWWVNSSTQTQLKWQQSNWAAAKKDFNSLCSHWWDQHQNILSHPCFQFYRELERGLKTATEILIMGSPTQGEGPLQARWHLLILWFVNCNHRNSLIVVIYNLLQTSWGEMWESFLHSPEQTFPSSIRQNRDFYPPLLPGVVEVTALNQVF